MFYYKSQNSSFLTMSKNKMGHFFQKQKKGPGNFSLFLNKWQTTKKLIKCLENDGCNLTYFCLGPKSKIGCRDPPFTLKSKIHVFGGTISQVVLILVLNMNCVRRSLCHDLASLRNCVQCVRIENQQSPIYVVNYHFSIHPDIC